MTKHYLITLCLILLASTGNRLKANNPTQKPNIIFVMIDDCSAVELSAYATKKHPAGNKTPVMDGLTKEGLMYTTCWATPLCKPTRALLMSGKYGYQTGVYGNKLIVKDTDYAEEHKPISKVLKENGYETAISGKWHLPGYPDDKSWGWDEYSLLGCYMTPKTDMVWNGLWFSWKKASYTFQDSAIIGKNNQNYPAMYWNGAVIENGELLPSDTNTYAPDLCQNFALQYVKKNHTKPFFLYYPMVLPHDPWLGTPNPKNPGQRTKPGISSLIQQVERYIDELIITLKETGVYDNSIIILTADNATLQNGKGNCSELGVRVPLIITGGKLKKKGVTDALVDFSDFYPTLMDIAGIPLDENNGLNGKSFYPLLQNESFKSRQYAFSYLDTERTIRSAEYMMDGSGGIWKCSKNGNILDYKPMPEGIQTQMIREEFMKILKNYPAPSEAEFGKKKLEQARKKYVWPQFHPSMVKAIKDQDEWMNNQRRFEE